MIERENTPMTTSSDVIAGLELALASADAMIERLQGERAILRCMGCVAKPDGNTNWCPISNTKGK